MSLQYNRVLSVIVPKSISLVIRLIVSRPLPRAVDNTFAFWDYVSYSLSDLSSFFQPINRKKRKSQQPYRALSKTKFYMALGHF